jgi:hypothetical protein
MMYVKPRTQNSDYVANTVQLTPNRLKYSYQHMIRLYTVTYRILVFGVFFCDARLHGLSGANALLRQQDLALSVTAVL